MDSDIHPRTTAYFLGSIHNDPNNDPELVSVTNTTITPLNISSKVMSNHREGNGTSADGDGDVTMGSSDEAPTTITPVADAVQGQEEEEEKEEEDAIEVIMTMIAADQKRWEEEEREKAERDIEELMETILRECSGGTVENGSEGMGMGMGESLNVQERGVLIGCCDENQDGKEICDGKAKENENTNSGGIPELSSPDYAYTQHVQHQYQHHRCFCGCGGIVFHPPANSGVTAHSHLNTPNHYHSYLYPYHYPSNPESHGPPKPRDYTMQDLIADGPSRVQPDFPTFPGDSSILTSTSSSYSIYPPFAPYPLFSHLPPSYPPSTVIPPPPNYTPLSPTHTPLDLLHSILLAHPVPVFDNCDTVRKRFLGFLSRYPEFWPEKRFRVFDELGPSVGGEEDGDSEDEEEEGWWSDGGLGDEFRKRGRRTRNPYSKSKVNGKKDKKNKKPQTDEGASTSTPKKKSRFPELLALLTQEHPQCGELGEDGFVWFMTLIGERAGMKSCFYYAGYVLFERLRIAKGEGKSGRRRAEERVMGKVGGWLGWRPRRRLERERNRRGVGR